MPSKSQFTEEQWAALKLRCCQDLYFLGKEVLKKDFVPNTHKLMCEFYVVKSPAHVKNGVRWGFKEFAEGYEGPHDRIQLVPRETFKSSIKVIDSAQWIINFPEIRIMTVTAEADLAKAFIDELVRYFTIRGKAERNPDTNLVEGGRPTEFQALFPEHCITESEANRGEFETPARKSLPANLVWKDPTVGAISMGGTSSGWHCDIEDFDDPVSDRNSESGNQLDKLRDRMSMINELVMNYGFTHYVATRYNPSDPYGVMAESHGIKELYGDFESDGLKYMCRPCLWLKGKPYEQPDYKLGGFPKEEEVDLFFPEGSPYKALKKKFKNRKIFNSQQLNNPADSTEMPFTEDMVRSCIVDHTALPKAGVTFTFWDLASSISKNADYTVGIVGMLDANREWWITDIVRGRFDFSEKCYQIVKTIKERRPQRTGVEDSYSARSSMTETLWRMAKQMNVELNIDWVTPDRVTFDAKYIRMCTLHPWVKDHRIHFLNTIECIDDLMKEFVNIGNKKAQNDIPDAMAYIVKHYSGSPIMTIPQNVAREQFQELRESEFERLIFRRGKYAPGSDWDRGWAPAQEPKEEERTYDQMTGLPS